ncbi:unnamed protein product [Amoebophrya sp. A25]|nr:unnamed protein product [Amoebophrya sp. A25]|eukprot:GSA25T00004801001.1
MASSQGVALMKAVAIRKLGGAEVLEDLSLPRPTLGDRDVLVQIKAFAMNPVDWKLRCSNLGMPFPENTTKILGYDGAGVIVDVGSACSCGFALGDEVYFSGSCIRDGTNAEFTAVDERLIAKKPSTLSFQEAAAFPLVAITGYENLVETMRLNERQKAESSSILILGGAGGCGSFGIQLCKALGVKQVIATASRPESTEWCKKLGADTVITHGTSKTLQQELEAAGIGKVDGVYVCHDDERYASEVVDIVKPMGVIAPVVTFFPSKDDVMKMYLNRVTLSFGMMFCRSIHNLEPEKQGALLREVAQLIDAGKISPVATHTFNGLSANTVREAHTLQETQKCRGKIVVTV